MSKTLRMMIDPPRQGVENMAIDEAILEAAQADSSSWAGTLRFYQWSQPTISLGYFQSYQELKDQDRVIQDMPVVRRQTGGGAILHDQELTYSLVLPIQQDGNEPGIEPVYRLVHDAIITSLKDRHLAVHYRGGKGDESSRRGPFFCFARRHRLDLVVGGNKLVGSAQRRRKRALLQHGSFILARRYKQQPCAALEELLDKPLNAADLIEKIIAPIANTLSLRIKQGPLSQEEQSSLARLTEKYQSPSWNHQR